MVFNIRFFLQISQLQNIYMTYEMREEVIEGSAVDSMADLYSYNPGEVSSSHNPSLVIH